MEEWMNEWMNGRRRVDGLRDGVSFMRSCGVGNRRH